MNKSHAPSAAHRAQVLVTPLLAFAAALAVIAAIIALSSASPAASLVRFFTAPFSSSWHIGNILNMAALLTFAGIGSALALRAGTFNLGGEAQIYASALVSAVILARFAPAGAAAATGFQTASIWILALVAAVAAGSFLGFIPGVLRSRFAISELLSSFLLSAALLPVIDYLVAGPFRDTKGNLLATPVIAKGFMMGTILEPSHLNASFAVALALTVLVWLFVSKTESGYRIRMTGIAPDFARFAGFPVARVTVIGMTASGAFHALTGFFATTGTWYRCHEGMTAGMGWSALACALIARGNPLAVIPSALIFAWLESASETAVISATVSFDPTPLLLAVVFLIISARHISARRPA